MESLALKLRFDGGEFGAGGVDALLEALLHCRVPGGGHGGLGIGDVLAVDLRLGLKFFQKCRVDSRGGCLSGSFRGGLDFCFGLRLCFGGESGFFRDTSFGF